MKVGFYIESSSEGGPDISLINLIRAWPNKNDTFIIFCNRTHPGLPRIKKDLNGLVIFVDLAFLIYIDLYLAIEKKELPLYLEKAVKTFLYLIRFPLLFYQHLLLKKIFCKFNLDLLLINNGGYPGAESCCAASVAASAVRIKTIMVVRGEPRKLRSWVEKLFEKLFDMIVDKNVNAFVAVSQAVKKAMIENRFLSGEKINVIYNGIAVPQNIKPQVFNKDTFNIGIVSNFRSNKGHLILFKAVEQLINKRIPVALYVIGSGTPREEFKLKNWVREKKIGHTILFLGFINNVYDYIAGLDLIVIPTIKYEACPVTSIEAMAMNVPVIASNVGGLSEIIQHGKNGLLFSSEKVKELSNLIEMLFKDDNFRSSLIKNGRNIYMTTFIADKMAEQYYKLIKKIVNLYAIP